MTRVLVRRVAVASAVVLAVTGLTILSLPDRAADENRAAGVRAILDPDTGLPTSDPEAIRRVVESSAAAPPLSTQEALRYSHEGLFEETLPNGMVVIDLQGRFAAPLVVELPDTDRAQAERGSEGPSR